MRVLLGSLQVSGWSGAVAGVILTPGRIPLFNDEELRLIAGPVTTALSQAGPRERVFFTIPNLAAPYRDERTAGSLFVRGAYLHLVLTDHSAFTRTDTGGGEDEPDLRDTKGMRLFVARPAQAAVLLAAETPHWGPFEKIHVSMKIQDVLAARASLPTAAAQAAQAVQPAQDQPKPSSSQLPPTPAPQPQPALKVGPGTPSATESADDLRLLLRELTAANLELRSRLKDQAQDVQALKEELTRLRQELTGGKAKPKPRKKSASPETAPK